MAERRMFAKSVVESDAFVDMPVSAQALYFHLGMNADDEGFINNPKMIQRCIGANADDLTVLASKGFVIPFDSGVIVIADWKRNNYLQKDRIKKSLCEEASFVHVEAGRYVLGPSIEEGKPCKTSKRISESREKRSKEYAESDLPYSFGYKIRNAFNGKTCPICGCVMSLNDQNSMPTIQHNIPISMGGKHEIGNISVICRSCNTGIQNRSITESLNNDEVLTVWESIENVSGMYTQNRLEENSTGKNIEEYESVEESQRRKSGEDFSEWKDAYNELCPSLQSCRVMSDKRKSAVRSMKKQGVSLEDFKEACRMAESSDFLKGKNDRGWEASPDWMFNVNNVLKVLEGNYSTRKGKKQEVGGYSIIDDETRRFLEAM